VIGTKRMKVFYGNSAARGKVTVAFGEGGQTNAGRFESLENCGRIIRTHRLKFQLEKGGQGKRGKGLGGTQ